MLAKYVIIAYVNRIGLEETVISNSIIPYTTLFLIMSISLHNIVKVNYMLILLIIESLFLVAYLYYVIHTHASP